MKTAIFLILSAFMASPAIADEHRCAADAGMISLLVRAREANPKATERGIVDTILFSYGQQNAPNWLRVKMYNLLDFAERNITSGAEGAATKYRVQCAESGPIGPDSQD
jgi:hypothetical protein